MDYTNDDTLIDPLVADVEEVLDPEAELPEDTEDNNFSVYDVNADGEIEEAA